MARVQIKAPEKVPVPFKRRLAEKDRIRWHNGLTRGQTPFHAQQPHLLARPHSTAGCDPICCLSTTPWRQASCLPESWRCCSPPVARPRLRSEERRVGKGGVRTGRFGGA